MSSAASGSARTCAPRHSSRPSRPQVKKRSTVTLMDRPSLSNLIPVTRSQFEALAASEQSPRTTAIIDAFLEFGYYLKGVDTLFLIPDNSRYVNHSFEPNSA